MSSVSPRGCALSYTPMSMDPRCRWTKKMFSPLLIAGVVLSLLWVASMVLAYKKFSEMTMSNMSQNVVMFVRWWKTPRGRATVWVLFALALLCLGASGWMKLDKKFPWSLMSCRK
jgi:hypothetical protein